MIHTLDARAGDIYFGIGQLLAGVSFLAVWAGTVALWGLVGLVLGWMPALLVAGIAYVLGPLVLLFGLVAWAILAA